MDAIIAEFLRQELDRELIAKRRHSPEAVPTKFDIYVASSGLQKAIRRGDENTALSCAARLLATDAPRLWRRLVTISFEDIGIGDPEIVGRVVAATGNHAWRQRQGGDWIVASYLVIRMCQAVKDRTGDDLVVLCEYSPLFRDQRKGWALASNEFLIDILHSARSLEEAGLACWFLVGTRRLRTEHLLDRLGDADTLWGCFHEAGISDTYTEIARLGMMRGGYVLAPLFPLILDRYLRTYAVSGRKRFESSRTDSSDAAVIPEIREEQPENTIMIGGMPSYAFDGFTRGGKQAIRLFTDRSAEWRSFLKRHVQRDKWQAMTTNVLFRVDGATLNKRLSWVDGDRILVDSDRLIPGLASEFSEQAMNLLREEMPTMNSVRREVIENATSNL